MHPLQYNAQSHSSMYDVYLILYYIAFFNHATGGSRNESRTPRWRKLLWPVRGGCAGNLMMRKAEGKDWICELLEVRGSGTRRCIFDGQLTIFKHVSHSGFKEYIYNTRLRPPSAPASLHFLLVPLRVRAYQHMNSLFHSITQ